jgi:Resolvase, N terminal domain
MLGRTAPDCPGSGCPGAPTSKRSRADDVGLGLVVEGACTTVPMRLTAAYARVSSDRQEKDQTIDSQLDALHQGAAERDLRLTEDLIFVDKGFSGARLDRPALHLSAEKSVQTSGATSPYPPRVQ